jgi:hypothetical protein
MFESLFLSKNQKLVKKWRKEHEQIVVLATNVIGEYQKHNPTKSKAYLSKLNILAVEHLMSEDIEFYRLRKDKRRLTSENEVLIKEFSRTFKGTKIGLMHFLANYTKADVVLDEHFIKEFRGLVEILAKRIEFEEENLYKLLYAKG